MPILIADVSDFQRPIDPAAYQSVGITGIIAKVTESNNFATKTHVHNLQAARAAGMWTAGYHFLHYRDPGQADWYLNHVEAAWGGHDGIAHMLDVEQEAVGKNPDISDIRAFTDRFYARTNNHPLLIYSGNWYWKGYIGNPLDTCGSQLVDASYVNGGGDPRNIVKNVTMGYWRPYGAWQGPLLRQFTSSAAVPGEPFPVDCSVLYGSEAELNALLRGSTPPPPPPEPWATRPTVRQGDGMPPAAPSEDVRYAQTAIDIINNRVTVVADGRFGPATTDAVKNFQAFLHASDSTVAVDGVIGPVTWRGIYFFLALAGQP